MEWTMTPDGVKIPDGPTLPPRPVQLIEEARRRLRRSLLELRVAQDRMASVPQLLMVQFTAKDAATRLAEAITMITVHCEHRDHDPRHGGG
jgi:hypothetical protein